MAETRKALDPHITVDWGGDDVHLRVHTGQVEIAMDVPDDLAECLVEDLQRAIDEIRRHRALNASGQVNG